MSMRVAYICADAGVPVFGHKGCSIHVQEFLRALLRQQISVRLYASRIGGLPGGGLENLTVCEVPISREGTAATREQAALGANGDLRRMLERDGPFDLLYERYSLFSYSAMEYAGSLGVSGVLEVNAPLIEEQARYRTLVDRASAEAAARRVFAAASTLVAVSEEVAAYLSDFPQAHGRIQVVHNGVDPRRFRPRDPGASPAGPFTVGFVGSLKPWHGVATLIEAFAIVAAQTPGARLLIVGNGPEREVLEALVSARGLREAVHFTGAVYHEDVPAILSRIDVAVAPYPPLPHFYFSPLKIYEYMAAGLAVIASRSGQIPQLLEDGLSGLLYRPGDAGELAAALERLRRDPELRRRLGRAARAKVLRGYTWDRVARRILEACGFQGEAGRCRAGALT